MFSTLKTTLPYRYFRYLGYGCISACLFSCTAHPTPCDCATAFISQNSNVLKRCDEYYTTLSNQEKETWAQELNNCDPRKSTSENTSSSNQASLPSEIQIKIDRINQLTGEYDAIRDAGDMFSLEQLEVDKKKFTLIQSAKNMVEEIENSGYANGIQNFKNVKLSIGLKYSGLKMQIEGLVEMANNGTIK